ncbi:hypothetical protein BHMPCIPO_02516 [Ensifer sesbaniae]|nr:hypothetical protein [Ensifer sesbaniae]
MPASRAKGARVSVAAEANFHSLDLFEQQLETVEFAANLRPDIAGENAAISRLKLFQALAAIAMHGFVALNALAQEQSFDAVDVENPLGDQRFTLSANPAAILFFGRWHPDHRANPWLSAFVCHQRADQRLAINSISLCPSVSARHRNRRGIDNVTFDPDFTIQNPVDPEPVKPCFLDDHKRIELPQSCLCLLPQISEDGEKASEITARDRMAGHLVASRSERRRQPGRFTQFQRHENYAKIDTDSGRRLSLNGYLLQGHLLLSECFDCSHTLPER